MTEPVPPFHLSFTRRVFAIGIFVCAACGTDAAEWKFDFRPDRPAESGVIKVPRGAAYDSNLGYGFLDAGTPAPGGSSSTAIFAVNVEEGNYDVTIRFGDATSATSTTVKAESRRLMLKNVAVAAGKYETRSFTVNTRRPAINTGGSVLLNTREQGPPLAPNWDDYLTFEFNGKQPAVASLEIKPAKDAVTVFLAGDSTVTDQKKEPYAGWGQMLPNFFRQGVAISNQAESGLALRSFESQKRLQKILSMMKKGDYLFIQFGHNDQKDKRPDSGPFTTYKANLVRFVEAAREKGGIPVLVTPMERRRFEENGEQPATLADYAEAARQVAAEQMVPLIDLNAMSVKLYAALGAKNSTKAFVFYPANTYPGQTKALKDNTHHSTYGGYELARCVVEGIKANVPELATRLAPDVGSFDPAKPDAPESLQIPPSPLQGTTEKPAGS